MKDDSGTAGFVCITNDGRKKVMDVMAGLPGCAGQAADAVSAYTQVKNGGHVQILGQVHHDTSARNLWSNIGDPGVPLERNLYGHPLVGILWERPFEKGSVGTGMEESTGLGLAFFCASKEMSIPICICG